MRDREAKAQIAKWSSDFRSGSNRWFRCRGIDEKDPPYLFVPGSREYTVLPDALFVRFILDEERYIEGADVIAVEVCATRQNLYDKRARYSNQSRLGLYCPERWLSRLTEIEVADTGLQNIPVRYLSALFALSREEYSAFKKHMPPWGHEYFVCCDDLERLTSAPDSLLSRMCPEAHFFDFDVEN